MGSMDSFNLPRSMRALEYTAAQKFSIVEKALPKIREHDILIKVKACGVCGTDLHIHDSGFGAQFPLTPGHETVGTVAAFGLSVTSFAIGDRVVADNSELCGHCHYCQYAVYPAHRVFKFHNLSDIEATLLEPASCAAHGLDKISPQMGSKVLLFGAGPTGLMLAQLLRQNGGCHLVIAAPGGVKMELARDLDAADEFVELPREESAAAARMEELRREHPYGFDVVVEATGSARVLENAIHFVTKGGKLVVYGVYDDEDRISLSPNMIFKEEIQVLGSFSQTNKFPAAIDYLDRQRINVDGIVNITFKLEEWEECLEAMKKKSVVKAAIVFD
ncbi:alcohol dehydrogenase [Aspergillus ellipticus CBS 707.79]|uniref:Alcohol dehydrogenase n=1 Tax=Aspergillus ellipticus CBS 707.79 TaxID=1448320 RepID=A0A319D1E7_9EURO|nr:alcohol dehydrogenase [Aspergillus ellipticus CBS 707.79]